MAFSSGSGGGPLSEINVTPLVDVMLVLLIIFMIAAPMLTTGVKVDLPKADAPRMDIDQEHPLITVQRDQRIFLFDEEVSLDVLRERLVSDQRILDVDEVFVQADEQVPYGVVAQVLALVRQAGIGKMGLVTDPVTREPR
ncbi:MAG: protein TolR [Deltaproteobacteria bacterium]|jgi:biopolymer transport protein TolR|nr:ExbD/TolR family protein [Deltaproteobacteria bacterium]MBW2189137.1 ExbD/TolR family protein [Deltaproteobacteria bacterium]MBW2223496.1 ExbD/TolR family protein [Deltaproteobacteria bacterium]MBW2404040.1 ExbD/TolR family protein [Deltaproteobacteria bacterium]MBW2546252.1 ExbD/TolR family protein [Deltaproteobacteria bacterium]